MFRQDPHMNPFSNMFLYNSVTVHEASTGLVSEFTYNLKSTIKS